MDVGTNEQLREVMRQSGLTHDAAARAVNRIAAEQGVILRVNKSSITHWINGTTPRSQTVAYLCEALSRHLGRRMRPVDVGYGDADDRLTVLPDDPVDALTRLGRADVDRRHVLTSAVYSVGALLLPVDYLREAGDRHERAMTGRIGWAEVEAVTDITAAFNRADEKLGGGFGRTAVVEYLTTDVATYCDASAPEVIRSAMFSAGAQLAYLSGWKAHDIGREGLAQRYYLHAYQLAVESGDLGQAAYIMRILAHQAYDIGQHANCVDLASSSVQLGNGRVDCHTQALLLLTLAKAYAMNGQRRLALAAIIEADKQMAKASADSERPAWAGIHGLSPAQFNNHVAKVLVDLGDFKGAADRFNRSLTLYLNRETMPRIYALTSTWLAEAQCKQGHIELACHTWSDALDLMGGIQSSRTLEAKKSMRRMLSPYRKRGIPAVARLLQPV